MNELATAPPLPAVAPPPLPPEKAVPRRLMGSLAGAFDALVGFFTMVVVLAIVSTIPFLNLLSLGYLLEASARVAKTGKLRNGFVGLHQFAAVGKIVFGVWFWVLPVRLLYGFWIDAELISSGSSNAEALFLFLIALIVLVVLHLSWALLRGGKLRYFFWPAPVRFVRWLSAPGKFDIVKRALLSFWSSLRLLEYGWMGARGFAGAAIWLALPISILMAASTLENNGLALVVSLLGGLLLGISVLYVPFLQTNFAITGRFRDFFSISSIRELFRKAPLAFWFALFLTLLFAIPLYLLKIELTPREVAWLPNVIFVLFIFPARLLVGWAISRGRTREAPRIWVSRWGSRLAAVPVVLAYAIIVWLTQFLSWHGTYSLLEQHAFLVPAPLLGL